MKNPFHKLSVRKPKLFAMFWAIYLAWCVVALVALTQSLYCDNHTCESIIPAQEAWQ